MSLIFDSFESKAAAEAFVAGVQAIRPGRGCQVFADHGDANAHDPFPFMLDGVVVHVDRLYHLEVAAADRDEGEIISTVKQFGGRFAGT